MSDLMKREQRSKIMRSIKSKNTTIEVRLAKALWHKGFRYRKNDKSIFGTPDLVFKKYKIAIFIDGEFFHGYNWEQKKLKLKDNREYWISKIERNMIRDKNVNEYLSSKGWKVLRFWGQKIKSKLQQCVKEIENEIIDSHNKIFYLNKI